MKYKYNLVNLDCANCALKIENKLNENKKIRNARVNFNTLKLTFETDEKNPLEMIRTIVSQVEPDVKVFENEQVVKTSFQIVRLIIGIILAIVGVYVKLPWYLNTILTILAYIILLARTIKNAWKLLIKDKTINENFLITISCIGAYLVGEHMEGLMVIILYEIGKILEDKAVNKSRNSIKSLMDIKPEFANLKIKDKITSVSPESVKIGDVIIIKNGEKIPLDGIVISGRTTLDTKALTGESLPREVVENDHVMSGSINLDSVIDVKVTNTFTDSTVSKILDLVENATDRKAKTETTVSKLARIYTPIVLGLAILTAILLPILTTLTFQESIYRALIFLVISCPCAIAISVPLSYFSAIGKASNNGILIKGSDYLDNLRNIKTIVFDKTGTLTKGEFSITKVNVYDKSYTKDNIINLIAKGESFSNHPLAKALLNNVDNIDTSDVKGFKEKAGLGLEYKINNDKYLIGSSKLVGLDDQEGIFIKKNDKVIGSIILKDTLKENTKKVINNLKEKGLNLLMFTGDNELSAKGIATDIKIDYKANMLPNDKYEQLELLKENSVIAFVGDGINDSPTLALADIGISMGGVGSNAAIEASDIVIMNDDLSKINEAIILSNNTNKIIKQNLIFAISTKVIILLLSVIGIAGMWQAIFADVGVTLITILNTLRLLK